MTEKHENEGQGTTHVKRHFFGKITQQNHCIRTVGSETTGVGRLNYYRQIFIFGPDVILTSSNPNQHKQNVFEIQLVLKIIRRP